MAGFKMVQEQKLKLVPTLRVTHRMIIPAVGLKLRPEREIDRELPAELLQVVARLIENEDRSQPVTDSELAVAATREMGCDDISRADIALARKQLGYGTSEERLTNS